MSLFQNKYGNTVTGRSRNRFFSASLRLAAKILAVCLVISIPWLLFANQLSHPLLNLSHHLETSWQSSVMFPVCVAVILLLTLLLLVSRQMRSATASLQKSAAGNILFKQAPIALGTLNDRTIQAINDQLCTLTQFSPEELTGKPFQTLFPDAAEYARVESYLNKLTTDSPASPIETRWHRKDESTIHISLHARLSDSCEFEACIIFAAIDITAQFGHNQAVIERERKYQALIDLAADGIMIFSERGNILEVNQFACTLLGIKKGDLLQREYSQLLFINSVRNTGSFPFGSLAVGERDIQELQYLRPDNTKIFIEIRATLMPDGTIRAHLHDITQRRMAESALRESEDKFNIFFNSSPDAIFIVRLNDRTYMEANKRFLDLFGYSRDEIINQSTSVFSIWSSPSDQEHKVTKITQNGFCNNFEAAFLKKDGSTVHGLISAKRFLLQDTPHCISIIRDISSQKNAQQEIIAHQRLFETMFNAIPDAIFITDANRKILLANQSALSTFGYKFEELHRKSTEMMYADPAMFIEIGKAISYAHQPNSSPRSYHIQLKNKKGVAFPSEITIRRLLNNAGTFIGNLTIIRDLSQRRQEEVIRELLATAINQAGEAIVITDAQGKIMYTNPAFDKISGHTPSDTYSLSGNLLAHITQPDEVDMDLLHTIMQGETWTGRRNGIRKNQEKFTETVTISPVFDDMHNITHFIAIKRDITEHVKLEAQYLQAQKMEAIGRLTGGVAHDFNNILAVVIGYSEMALEERAIPLPIQHYLEIILKAAQQSADLVRQLLAFSRQQAILPKVIDLNATIEDMLSMLQRLIGEHIKLIWSPEPQLPSIIIDPVQIYQILANLCINSRDAIFNTGTIFLSTSVAASVPTLPQEPVKIFDRYIRLSVRDSGHGIMPGDLDKIFDPFYSTKGVHGTGLGLATVYGIVLQNHGVITVESEQQQGTIFEIYLPASPEKEPVMPVKKSTRSSPSKPNRTILYVEDDAVILEMGSTMLDRLGYVHYATASPSKAIEIARECNIGLDILITDVIMPEMNGRELAEQISETHPDIKILYVSGYTSDVIAQHGVLNTGIHFLQKPFSIKQLDEQVQNILNRQNAL